MILGPFNNIVASNSLSLQEAKDKLRNSISKEFKSQIISQIPTPDSIKSQLNKAISNTEDLSKVKEQKNNLLFKCNSITNKVNGKIEELKGIKNKTSSITNKIVKLKEVVDIANEFVPEVKIAVTVGQTTLAFLGGLGSGLAIVKLSDLLKAAKGKLNEFDAVLKILDAVNENITSQSDPIEKQCNDAIAILERLLLDIESSCGVIEQTYAQLIAPYLDDATLDSDTQTDSTLEEYSEIERNRTNNNGNFTPTDPLDLLENSGKQPFIQRIRNNEKPTETGYKIIKK